MKNFNNSMADEYNTSQSNLAQNQAQRPDEAQGEQVRSQSRSSSRQHMSQLVSTTTTTNMDELMSSDLNYLQHDAPLDGGESTFGAGIYSQLGASQQLGRDESVMNMSGELAEDFAHRSDVESPIGFSHNEQALNQLSSDNVDIEQKPMQQAG